MFTSAQHQKITSTDFFTYIITIFFILFFRDYGHDDDDDDDNGVDEDDDVNGDALWFKTATKRDENIGPLDYPLAHLLLMHIILSFTCSALFALLHFTHSFTPHSFTPKIVGE